MDQRPTLNPLARHAFRRSVPAITQNELAALSPKIRSEAAMFFTTFASAFIILYNFFFIF